LLNAEALGQMKPGAILINTGRGPLVDEQALVAALASGHLGGAGLDVFEFEPEVTPRLLEFDNVTLLPHIGSATVECRTDMAMRALANIRQFLADGRPIDNCV
jgi:glyoxylate reductase